MEGSYYLNLPRSLLIYLRTGQNIVGTIAYFSCRYGYGAVCCAVIEVNLIGFLVDSGTVWEYNVTNIADTLVGCARSKDPLIASAQDFPGTVQIQKSQADPVYRSRSRSSDAVIK